jgi:hypothetical protein
MVTEVSQRAAEGWVLAFCANPPMPPAVVLDYVQEFAGDRDDAFLALMSAAGDYLAERIPASLVSEVAGLIEEAGIVATYVRGFDWGMVRTHMKLFDELFARLTQFVLTGYDPFRPGPLVALATAFRAWDMRARRVVTLCQDIEEAV